MIASVRSGRMTTAYTAAVKLVATIHEETQDAAIHAIRSLPAAPDVVEVRLDAFGGRGDYRAIRAATSKPILVTNRGGTPIDADSAIAAGIDLIDVEHGQKVTHPDRTVLSFHDFERVPDLKPLLDAMTAFGCAHTKIAVTPQTLRENEELLAALRPGLTIFGMGERGLYSRILAPFFGSELAFVGNAAPGQLSLERAVEIYGDDHRLRKPEKIFAIAGNPAGHSLSPSIHNPLFRKRGVPAAYTIASFQSFDEIARAFDEGRIAGLSITAPFKEDAFRFAKSRGAEIRPNAELAEAANTLVRHSDGHIVAENTDVDGLLALIQPPYPRRAAVIGAGGTARAALVALDSLNIDAVVYNRTPKSGALPLETLREFEGDLVIDTLPSGVRVEMPAGVRIIAAAYDRGGLKLLHAQAGPQHDLFLEAFE
jgi:3-dehydroquinate dehydratase type I